MTADVGSLSATAAALAECAQVVELAQQRMTHLAEPIGKNSLPGHAPVRQLAEDLYRLLTETTQLLAAAHAGVSNYTQECVTAEQLASAVHQQCAPYGHHWDGGDQVFAGPGLSPAEQLADPTLGAARVAVSAYHEQTAAASRNLRHIVEQVASDAARLGTR